MDSVTTKQDSNTVEAGNASEAAPEGSSAKPISEFTEHPDYPECLRGQLIDIGGYVGVVAEIVHNSIKVRSLEGVTKSFNFHALRKLYGARVEMEPPPTTFTVPERAVEKTREPEPEAPKRNLITEPDFNAPVKPIADFVARTDFPQCTFGQHVEVNGYTGVVVEITNRSLKVRSQEEVTRSYNADTLRRLFAGR